LIHEPMTMATDYLLVVAAAYFAVRLWRRGARPWALAFAFTAIGSFTGGTYHGIGPHLHPKVDAALWKVTVFSIGLASFFLLTGAIVATTEGHVRRALMLFAVLMFIGYASWMIWHDDFKYVIADYGVSLVLVGLLSAIAWVRSRLAAATWILGSIGVAVIAAAVQQSGIGIHPQFDHNAVYHLIQLVSLWLLYRGGVLLMTSATVPPTNQPT
jgi:hypothetical protein